MVARVSKRGCLWGGALPSPMDMAATRPFEASLLADREFS